MSQGRDEARAGSTQMGSVVIVAAVERFEIGEETFYQ